MSAEVPAAKPTEPTGRADGSRRIYVLWGLGLAFLLALGLVCWLLLLPVLQVRRALHHVILLSGPYNPDTFIMPEEAVEELGGAARAAPKLAIYCRLPEWAVYRRDGALYLLTQCGEPAVPALGRILLSNAEESERAFAAQALGKMGRSARAAVPALIESVRREEIGRYQGASYVSGYRGPFGRWDSPGIEAIRALGQIGPEATPAVPVLGTMAKDESYAAGEARAALRRIAGLPEPPQMILKMDPMEVAPPPWLEE
jgi:hypothetical protein